MEENRVYEISEVDDTEYPANDTEFDLDTDQ